MDEIRIPIFRRHAHGDSFVSRSIILTEFFSSLLEHDLPGWNRLRRVLARRPTFAKPPTAGEARSTRRDAKGAAEASAGRVGRSLGGLGILGRESGRGAGGKGLAGAL